MRGESADGRTQGLGCAAGAMRAAVVVLCASALVGGALANQPTAMERQFAGLRIAIRAGDTEKAKKLLTSGARNWGKDFTDKQGVRESAGCTQP